MLLEEEYTDNHIDDHVDKEIRNCFLEKPYKNFFVFAGAGSGKTRSLVNTQFEVTIEAEKDTDLWIIPAEIYKGIMKESAPVANYTNELMATRFSDVMWLIEQIMWKSLDKRVASFLLEETSIEGTNELKITHETIANHLGSHREVITRMLRYFQGEGLVRLSRGKITILDSKRLETLQRS